MREFEKRILSQKRRRMIVRGVIRVLIPASIGGLVLGLTISKDFNEVFRIFFFCGIIALSVGFVVSIDRILSFFRLKKISFPLLQLIKLIIFTFVVLIIFVSYFGLKDNNLIFLKGKLHLFLPVLIYSGAIGLIFTLMLTLSRMVGYDVLWKYFLGKYHNPQEEERIFMFLDLKSSTTIAEQIGHKKFFSLMNDLLYEISDPIIQNGGEIYKYVGDETIITWSGKKGIRHNHCIRVFFEIGKRIARSHKKYMNQYGLVPELKAGVHIGKVIVGEMGDFKSEIAYLGDAVNTTARIQSECNTYKSNLLISGELLARLEKPYLFRYKELGKIRLKGKLSDTALVKVEPITRS